MVWRGSYISHFPTYISHFPLIYQSFSTHITWLEISPDGLNQWNKGYILFWHKAREPCFPIGFPRFPNDTNNSRDILFFDARSRNHVSPMVFQGFPITIRFPMWRRGTQRNAPCAICPNMQKPMVFQWFPWYGIVIPGRAAGGRIAPLPGTCIPGGRKRCVSQGFWGISNNHKIFGSVFFLATRKKHGFPLF